MGALLSSRSLIWLGITVVCWSGTLACNFSDAQNSSQAQTEVISRWHRRPTPTPTPTPAAKPTPTPAPTNASLFSDNFSSDPTGVCFNDGQVFESWTSVFSGYGCNSIVSLSNGNELSIEPEVSTSSSETHSGLVTGPSFSGNITLQVSLQTVKQLRTGSSPNSWEVGWVLWNYSDNTHFYYFMPKPNGWELGKEDPSYPGAQRFLATGSNPGFPIGNRYAVKITQSANTITVWVNGTQITSFTDTQTPYESGQIGFYDEDSQVNFQAASVTSP